MLTLHKSSRFTERVSVSEKSALLSRLQPASPLDSRVQCPLKDPVHHTLKIPTNIYLVTNCCGPDKMADHRICWPRWKQICVWTAKPPLYLTVCMNSNIIHNAHCFFRGLFWLVCSTSFLIITAVITNFFTRSTWCDEESPEDHCHILDTRHKMAHE